MLLHCLTKRLLKHFSRKQKQMICVVIDILGIKGRSNELLAKIELEDLDLILREREGFAGLGMWGILVVQSEQHVIYRLMAGWRQGGPS